MNASHRFTLHRCLGLLVGLTVTVLAGANPPALAAPLAVPLTFLVNTSADAPAGGLLTNGVCETAPGNGVCSLRAAIQKANNWANGGVTIHVPGLPGGSKYALTIDELLILQSMTLAGAGPANTIIDASEITPTARVLDVEGGITVTVSGLTLEGGRTEFGGGINVSSFSILTLTNSLVTGNVATHEGGGIYSGFGALALIDSQVSGNMGGVAAGGITIVGGTLTLRRVTVSHNQAGYAGGLETDSTHPIQIIDSTFSGNTANGTDGGGILNSDSALTIVNSTLSDNYAYRSGAGIYNNNAASGCNVRLYNVTLAGNAANQNLVDGTGGGIYNSAGSTVRLQNTLLDANVHSTDGQDVGDDCAGSVISQDNNLFSSTAGCPISGGTQDLKDVPGLTGPLQAHGGSTATNALLPGSPAIDAGNAIACTDNLAAALRIDQRGAPRPANGAGATRCDIGAYEVQRVLDLPLVLRE